MKISWKISRSVVRPAMTVIGLTLFCSAPLLHAESSAVPNTSIKINVGDIEQKPIAPDTTPKTDSSKSGTNKMSVPPVLSNTWIALAMVLGVILVVAWTLRKVWPGNNMLFGSLPVLQVLGRTHLSPKQTLALLKLDNKLLLIGITDHQISPLLTIDEPEDISRILTHIEQNRPAGITGGFRNLFSRENHAFEEETGGSLSLSDASSDKNGENGVLQLKTELNSLLKKVQKLKGNGG